MIRRPPRSTLDRSSAASDVYKRQRQTREDNARFFDGDTEAVPRHCLTQGVATILAARHLVLMAFGKGKAEAVHHLAEGPVSAMWPATALQLHPHVTVFVDDAAASRLQPVSYTHLTLPTSDLV